jgi:replicative DNA helicase
MPAKKKPASVSPPAAEELLPWSKDAEQWLLATLLMAPERIAEVADVLHVEDLFLAAHQRIYGAILALWNDGKPVDMVSVAEELTRKGQLEEVGGYSGIVALGEGTPEMVHLENLARVIVEKATFRRTALRSHALYQMCLRADASLEALQKHGAELFDSIALPSNGVGPTSPDEVIKRLPGGLNFFVTGDTARSAIPSGFRSLDAITGGFFPGELTLIGARPGAGKTSLVMNIAQHAALHLRCGVAVFSLEMSASSLLERMACGISHVSEHAVRTRKLNDDQRVRFLKAMNRIADAPLFIDDDSNCGIAEIRARLKKLVRRNPVHMVIIDYLQLMVGLNGRYESQQVEVNRVANALKGIAKEFNVPVLACSQLSRAPELRKNDPRPKLSDLRDSGGLEQAADVVLLIYRQEMYKPEREDLKGKAEIIVAKHRNGPQGIAKMVFLHNSTQFADLAQEEPPEGV